MVRKIRLDRLIVNKGLANSKSEAANLINSRNVKVSNFKTNLLFSHTLVPLSSEIILTNKKFVSRGGDKLNYFLDELSFNLPLKNCIDVGASTGGFTDALLKRGANKVYCIDSGKDQIHPTISKDPRVVSYEKINAKKEIILPIITANLIVVDVSFISTLKIIPNLIKFMNHESFLIILIKPQFEAKKNQVEQGGIVSDPEIHAEVLNKLFIEYHKFGVFVCEMKKSKVLGKKRGNQEYFCLLKIL